MAQLWTQKIITKIHVLDDGCQNNGNIARKKIASSSWTILILCGMHVSMEAGKCTNWWGLWKEINSSHPRYIWWTTYCDAELTRMKKKTQNREQEIECIHSYWNNRNSDCSIKYSNETIYSHDTVYIYIYIYIYIVMCSCGWVCGWGWEREREGERERERETMKKEVVCL